MKKINITTIALLVYLIVMSIIEISGIKTMILPSNKNTACFSSQKNRLNELYFITLVLILLLFRPHRLLECLIKTTHSINYSIINKYNLNRTHTPLVSLTFLK